LNASLAHNQQPSRYGKYLPPRLQDRYQEAIQDPTLLQSREDIALMDARLQDLLRRADTGESGRIWQQLKQAKVEMLQARQRKDSEGVQIALQQIMGLIDHGHGDHETWKDIRETVQERTRLVRSEQKRLVDMHQMVTVERLVNFMQTLSAILVAEIPEKQVARKIIGRIQGMMTVDAESRRVD
jgi:hypothetical protein